MKKIYSLIGAIALSLGAFAQQNQPSSFQANNHKATLESGEKLLSRDARTAHGLNKNAASPTFTAYVEPVGDVMDTKGLILDGTAGANQNLFVSGIFMDSTVIISGTSNRQVSSILLGSILDPKSNYISSPPLVDATESYNLDSLFILGSYVQVNAAQVDTLYTWVVWGDSTNTSVFSKNASSDWWIAPLSGWRSSLLCPNVGRTDKLAGNKVFGNAPAANMIRIKYVLTSTDVATGAGYIKNIRIGLPSSQLIPAGNIVSCFFTFVPGATYAPGDCIYSFSGAPTAQNKNGFAAAVWGQQVPALNAVSDYVDHQVDPDGWNSGLGYDKNQRHRYNTAAYWNRAPMDLVTAPVITYKISGPSLSTKIIDLDKKGFSLGQNIPNPFSNGSSVIYELNKEVKSATFTVTDVMGRVISIENVDATVGTHSVKLGAYAAGVYYYSLNVDGNVTTKKMIVE